MHRPALTILSVTVISFILPGCIIVATDRHYRRASETELESVRQIEPAQPSPTIRTNYRDQLPRLSPGDSIASFRNEFPSAVFVEQKQADGHKIDAYSLRLEE